MSGRKKGHMAACSKPHCTAAMSGVVMAIVAASLIVSGLAAKIALAAPAGSLVAHRAIYNLVPGDVHRGGEFVQADGRMWVEARRVCDGWLSSQRIKLNLLPAEGVEQSNDTAYTSWESLSGLSYRFATQVRRDGTVTERFAGTATLVEKGRSGAAQYEHPAKKTVPLPPGTVFPTYHLREILEKAEKGTRQFSRIVFDGTTEAGFSDVSTVIIPAKPTLSESKLPRGLPEGRRWWLRLAFFELGSRDPTPTYEMSVRLLDGGIAEAMTLDFGGMTVHARLAEFEELPAPTC
jgi:hypothetical protein